MVSTWFMALRADCRLMPFYVLIVAMLGMHFWYTTSLQFAGIHVYVVDAAVLLLYIAAAIELLRGGQLRVGYVGVAMIAFLLVLLIALFIGLTSGRAPLSALNDLKTGMYLATFFPASILISKQGDLERILKFALIMICVAAAYDIATRLGGPTYYPFNASASEVVLSSGVVSRAYGLVTAPPYYGVAIGFVGSALLYWPIGWRRFLGLSIVGLTLLALVLALLLRGVYVGLVAALFALLIFMIDQHRHSYWTLLRNVAFSVIGVAAAVAAVVLASRIRPLSPIAERIVSIVDSSASTSHASATTSVRLDFVIGAAIDLDRHGELLLGRGLGYSSLDRAQVLIGIEAFYPTLAYHSAAGWVLSKTGFCGSAVFVGFILVFFARAFIVSRLELTPQARAVLIGGVMSFAFLAVSSLAENYLLQYAYGVPLAGLLLAVPEIVARSVPARAPAEDSARNLDTVPCSRGEPLPVPRVS